MNSLQIFIIFVTQSCCLGEDSEQEHSFYDVCIFCLTNRINSWIVHKNKYSL